MHFQMVLVFLTIKSIGKKCNFSLKGKTLEIFASKLLDSYYKSNNFLLKNFTSTTSCIIYIKKSLINWKWLSAENTESLYIFSDLFEVCKPQSTVVEEDFLKSCPSLA